MGVMSQQPQSPPPRVFFTADTHFGHANVINYSHRPFRDVVDMTTQLVANWNATVGPHDVVYHLGDFALCKPAQALDIAAKLNGRKYIVWGNHDKAVRKGSALLNAFAAHFTVLEAQTMIRVPDVDAGQLAGNVQCIVLSHYAMRVWDRSHFGTWHLFGHSHGSMPDDPTSRSLDVGVDVWDYRPVSYEQIKARIATKTWQPVDGHADR